MADNTTDKPVVPVPKSSVPHDRVASLSLNSDGSIAGNNPELIGDKDAALEATKKQFADFAVSAIDAEKRAELGLAGATADEDTSDKLIDALRAEHDKAAAAAEKRAEQVVNDLHNG